MASANLVEIDLSCRSLFWWVKVFEPGTFVKWIFDGMTPYRAVTSSKTVTVHGVGTMYKAAHNPLKYKPIWLNCNLLK